MVMTVTALTGMQLSAVPALASLPLMLQFLATMLFAVPASLLMSRIGRRAAFRVGQAVGFFSALCAAEAIVQSNFLLFALAGIGLGIHNAFWQHLRFAAAEVVEEGGRPRAISYVLGGGVAAALVGPWLATHTRELLPSLAFAGCYLAVAGLCGANILLLQGARLEPGTTAKPKDSGRPLRLIVRQPAFIAAVTAATIGYAAMILVMTATPLAMQYDGFSFVDTAFVIQWHVLGMYLPSFWTGRLIERFGVDRIIVAGVLLYLLTMGTSLSGATLGNFWLALVALGVGWNFLFVGGTSLLTRTYRPQERAKVQGLNDLVVFGAVALASLASGALFTGFGWAVVNLALVVSLVAVPLLLRSERQPAAPETH